MLHARDRARQKKSDIYAFDQSTKLDMERIRRIFDHPSAYEQAGRD